MWSYCAVNDSRCKLLLVSVCGINECGSYHPNGANLYGGCDGGGCVCVCVCVLAHACARVRWHACVRDAIAIYDNKICPMLIRIIIKISILYFKQIRHTDDFPSTGRPYPSSQPKLFIVFI